MVDFNGLLLLLSGAEGNFFVSFCGAAFFFWSFSYKGGKGKNVVKSGKHKVGMSWNALFSLGFATGSWGAALSHQGYPQQGWSLGSREGQLQS